MPKVTVTPQDLVRIQDACRILESGMVTTPGEALDMAAKACSPPIAVAIFVAKLRRNMGCGVPSQPTPSGADDIVAALLDDIGLVIDELGHPPSKIKNESAQDEPSLKDDDRTKDTKQ